MWELVLDFVTRYEDDEYWYTDDGGYHHTFRFDTESEARAFYSEAHQVISQGWLDDEKGVRPCPAMLDFVRRHNVVLVEPGGAVSGGYANGVPVGRYELALIGILSVGRYEDLTYQWEDECGSAS